MSRQIASVPTGLAVLEDQAARTSTRITCPSLATSSLSYTVDSVPSSFWTRAEAMAA